MLFSENMTLARLPRIWNIVPGVFTPVLAKHSTSFSLIDCISVGVEQCKSGFVILHSPEACRRLGHDHL